MEVNQEEAFLKQDREDLLALLAIRFGTVPAETTKTIEQIQDFNRLQRLILAACNVPEWKVFQEELQEDEGSYRLLGERFNPLGNDF
ncbi:hypothetical protein [Paenibacillus apiarius]|uniref:Uncharacterized protein n=1 Tax=Paenibacillus apiarius TaxID=46240 RepID=A0ABT4E176_9BACL|nr:hypothetical protein [Paenibacillus apiarius]MBN3526485.1 hypothetical protein [Paenibacillus apiarius]MCY9517057.1 hypothetical protein [Paenibacillus apiarius]MCY9523235.1 hypothetical protein [Paenibacillus apiarius]MCY9554267.1 hypothetical protein [Paenibacillus apiarius]MCY9560878.1 hypothetical protein [Paenibacillus apiarius]